MITFTINKNSMKLKQICSVFFILFMLTHTNAFKRILYVDSFSSILGNTTSENKLLSFTKRYGFNCLVLYELNKVHKKYPLQDKRTNKILAKFISKAKSTYNIDEIAAVGEASEFFVDVINPYNNSRNSVYEKFDVYNLEYEYWSQRASGEDGYYCENYLKYDGYECTRAGSFRHFTDDLKILKSLAEGSSHDIKIEAFLGYFKEFELNEITKYADRIIVESYDKNPKLCVSKIKNRLNFLAKFKSKTKISVLFSSTMEHMGKWLKYDSLDRTEIIFNNEIKLRDHKLSQRIKITNFGYHTYSYLVKSLSYYAYSQN